MPLRNLELSRNTRVCSDSFGFEVTPIVPDYVLVTVMVMVVASLLVVVLRRSGALPVVSAVVSGTVVWGQFDNAVYVKDGVCGLGYTSSSMTQTLGEYPFVIALELAATVLFLAAAVVLRRHRLTGLVLTAVASVVMAVCEWVWLSISHHLEDDAVVGQVYAWNEGVGIFVVLAVLTWLGSVIAISVEWKRAQGH